jgi:hypothetical protein
MGIELDKYDRIRFKSLIDVGLRICEIELYCMGTDCKLGLISIIDKYKNINTAWIDTQHR